MRLIISRDQKRGFGAIDFVLSCKLEVSAREEKLFTEYGLKPLILGGVEGIWQGKTVGSFLSVAGIQFAVDNVRKALAVEEEVKKGCQRLRIYLEAASSYGGREELEF